MVIKKINEMLAELKESGEAEEETPSEASTAKLLEELKLIVRELPIRLERRLSDSEMPDRRRRIRRYHSMLFDELMHMLPGGPEDPIAILLFTSIFREDAPWLYELGREAFDSLQTRSLSRRKRAFSALRRVLDITMRSRMGEEIFGESKESYMMFRDMAKSLERTIERVIDALEQP